MIAIAIKNHLKDTVIGFNNSGIPLGKRSESDLIDLALLAHSSGDPTILELFEKLPSVSELKSEKMSRAIKKTEPKKDQLSPGETRK